MPSEPANEQPNTALESYKIHSEFNKWEINKKRTIDLNDSDEDNFTNLINKKTKCSPMRKTTYQNYGDKNVKFRNPYLIPGSAKKKREMLTKRLTDSNIDGKALSRMQTFDQVDKNKTNSSQINVSSKLHQNRDQDPAKDVLMTGYSQKSCIGNTDNLSRASSISRKSTKKATHNNLANSIRNKMHKHENNFNRFKEKPRESSQEKEEVSRILNVLQKNLNHPTGYKLGYNTDEDDTPNPQRDRVRSLLHKHLQMKEEQVKEGNIINHSQNYNSKIK